MLPFMKKKDEVSAGNAEDESITRKPDEGQGFGMLDAVADDMLEAFQKGDKALLKSALDALVEHIQSEDQEQDQQLI